MATPTNSTTSTLSTGSVSRTTLEAVHRLLSEADVSADHRSNSNIMVMDPGTADDSTRPLPRRARGR